MDWEKLLSTERLEPNSKPDSDCRNEFERDFDRVLYSAPTRRMADKTQVFPLDLNDTIRTRLTHSHEVASLARSLGVRLISETEIFSSKREYRREVPALLATLGLVVGPKHVADGPL